MNFWEPFTKTKNIKRDRLLPFKSFWRSDDAEWSKVRTSDWKKIRKVIAAGGTSAKSLKKFENYFLRGDIDGYIPPNDKFFMTPLTCAQEVSDFFYSDVFGFDGRATIISGFLGYATKMNIVVSWAEEYASFFQQGVLGDTYRTFYEESGGRVRRLSPSAEFNFEVTLSELSVIIEDNLYFDQIVKSQEYLFSFVEYAAKKKVKSDRVIKFLTQVENTLMEKKVDHKLLDLCQNILERKALFMRCAEVKSSVD
ncbi:hypothetical protein EZV61_09600 [Corallincola luteus]|uniref:Uncharacterized protein n=1 Tax=Corallincola luteus TaxID=1775177 RepID=A0ABY2AN79_9GAMM|nr:hypothetical protein [Corallincola luteus]TCI03138.1 hypothetical protein EZV61_09600 [Corallincola luteus]